MSASRFLRRSLPPGLLLGLALVWGCARAPMAPDVGGGIVNPSFVRVAPPEGAGTGLPAGPLEGSGLVNGDQGGEVVVGRFRVIVPPGAFDGDATISILVPNPALMTCELHISPPEANHFAVPVRLVSDCSGASGVDLSKLETLWFDDGAGVWRIVDGSEVDLQAATVSTPLEHFSVYGVVEGKAGW